MLLSWEHFHLGVMVPGCVRLCGDVLSISFTVESLDEPAFVDLVLRVVSHFISKSLGQDFFIVSRFLQKFDDFSGGEGVIRPTPHCFGLGVQSHIDHCILEVLHPIQLLLLVHHHVSFAGFNANSFELLLGSSLLVDLLYGFLFLEVPVLVHLVQPVLLDLVSFEVLVVCLWIYSL